MAASAASAVAVAAVTPLVESAIPQAAQFSRMRKKRWVRERMEKGRTATKVRVSARDQ